MTTETAPETEYDLRERIDELERRLARLEDRERRGRMPQETDDAVRFGRRSTDPQVSARGDSTVEDSRAAAQLVARQMAISGYRDDEIIEYLAGTFGIEDAAALVAESRAPAA